MYKLSCKNVCTWNLGGNYTKGYDYLNNACYLDGVFTNSKLDCPTGSHSSIVDTYTEKLIKASIMENLKKGSVTADMV